MSLSRHTDVKKPRARTVQEMTHKNERVLSVRELARVEGASSAQLTSWI
jgi:hypothetical protein